ncbi:sigma-54-dependent transcriptional regulator [Algoriphagus aquimarinus]|uniref:DNA-binding transcriptional response regulator, NtrC family, contains REC, AAA-type ATPase, and a Fis-type DNA-binding domains n=1 Tax=Algoriphagus aquimarinus TaxID=237018 RepID=A0A1I0ZKB2_9BACT|nr:sigma-54 dependent transcriptional regulator [Algoriphagus aquimarinus]SFB25556.1 DNA-binding transcriptional response regulator, NtrC family, contains REC, AAA-type ATPase, and a Fis-type DNA-binding domains [Algoriphagus aquimarinus]|tara:strand:- start:15780 stop:17180 length:1401 start_codon:yes stop_codon:yes gene_type:complete
MKHILLVEDDLTYSRIVKTFLEKNGFSVQTAIKVKEAQQLFSNSKFDLIIADFRLPDGTGMELLQWSKINYPDTQVILITHYSDIRIAIKAMKLGAFEYITKPINPDELLATVKESLSAKVPEPASAEPIAAPSAPKAKFQSSYVIGNSVEAEKLEKHIQLVSPTDLSVLVMGETGTGKEFISRRIHDLSARKDGPFIAIDCGALPKELAGSELFGHVKGAFTGALENKTGHFEMANGGTIFLDEIGNLGYEVQIQLLRAIQERTIRKIGGNKEIQIDVRIIAATNDNLIVQAGDGHFREDLYHRLNEFTLSAIPLRNRKDDLEDFADQFLEESNERLVKSVKGFSPEVWEIFLGYDWPGNLRELRNIIKRAVLLSAGSHVEKEALPADLYEPSTSFAGANPSSNSYSRQAELPSPKDYKSQWVEQEKELIQKVLMDTKFNKSKTARILNMDRKTLYSKMEKYGLD